MSGRRAGAPVDRFSLSGVAAAILSGSLLLVIALPLLALVSYSSPAALASVASDPVARSAGEITLYASAVALVAGALTGIPLGYLLARRAFPGRSVVASVVTLPIVLPHLIAGLAIFLLFAPSSPVGMAAARLHLSVLESFWGVVLVMTYVSVPYLVLASESAFRSLDPALRETARTLGAGPMTVFWTVSLPAAGRGIVAGLLLAWARSISEIGAFLIVANVVYPAAPYYGPATAPVSVYVYSLFEIGNTSAAVALSVWMLGAAFVIFLGVRLLEWRGALPRLTARGAS